MYAFYFRLLKKTENSKIKTAKRIQNVKDAAKGQNDYNMSGLLSNATFIDKAVYHSGCMTKYLLTRTRSETNWQGFCFVLLGCFCFVFWLFFLQI
jgi:hypothetical protein